MKPCARLLAIPERRAQPLVYRCASDWLCGGLGDRLKGVISAFVLAALTDRPFYLRWDRSSHLDRYWVPSHWDWRWSGLSHAMLRPTQLRFLDRVPDVGEVVRAPATSGIEMTANKPVMPAVLEAAPAEAKLAGITECDDAGMLAAAAFHHLFRPSLALSRELRKHVPDDCWRVAVHVRTGNGGAFEDPSMASAAEVDWVAATAVAIARARPATCFFVFSDSVQHSRRIASDLRDVSADVWTAEEELAGLPLSHLDHPGPLGGDDRRTFIEHAMIMNAHLVLGTPSGFTASASAISCAPMVVSVPEDGGTTALPADPSVMLDGLCMPRRPPFQAGTFRGQPPAFFASARKCPLSRFVDRHPGCLPGPRPASEFWVGD